MLERGHRDPRPEFAERSGLPGPRRRHACRSAGLLQAHQEVRVRERLEHLQDPHAALSPAAHPAVDRRLAGDDPLPARASRGIGKNLEKGPPAKKNLPGGAKLSPTHGYSYMADKKSNQLGWPRCLP